MGILIGDGYLGGTPTFSTGDPEVIDLVNSFLPPGYKVKHRDRCTYIINGHEKERRPNSLVTKAVKEYGLFGHTAAQKFIPKNYLYGSKEQRLWLLKGLMDADGTTDGGNASYCTISEQLANDIIELVHSLGGYASKQVKKADTKIKTGTMSPAMILITYKWSLIPLIAKFLLLPKNKVNINQKGNESAVL